MVAGYLYNRKASGSGAEKRLNHLRGKTFSTGVGTTIMSGRGKQARRCKAVYKRGEARSSSF